MKLIEKKDNQIIFSIEINHSLANAVRRYVNEIPVLAIDEVEISKNDSPLYDETISHRLGLIPLKMDKSISEKSTPKFKLNSKKEGMICSKELKGGKGIVYENMPITMTDKGQEVELVAKTKMGLGSKHSKFSPGLMFYREFEDPEKEASAENSSKELIITLESFGQLSVKDIFIKSIETLKKDLAAIQKKIK